MPEKIIWVSLGPIPDRFDGDEFAKRYGLKPTDFEVCEGNLRVPQGVIIPDSPPIMESVIPEKHAKRQRAALAKQLTDDGSLSIMAAMVKKMRDKPTMTIDEIKAETVAEFIEGESKRNK